MTIFQGQVNKKKVGANLANKKIVLVGGGNGAHVLACLASRKGCNVHILTRRPEAWSTTMTLQLQDEITYLKSERPILATRDASVVSDADLIILCGPVHIYPKMLENIRPHLSDTHPTMLGTLFGQGGFDWMCERHAATATKKNIVVFAMQKIPWTCRATTYGSAVRILGSKKAIKVGVNQPHRFKSVQSFLAGILEVEVQKASLLALVLSASNNVIHPGRYYGLFHNWNGKDSFDSEKMPLLYEDMDEFSASVIEGLDAERCAVVQEIVHRFPETKACMRDAMPLVELTVECYGDLVKDPTNVQSIFRTNEGYRWFKVPMRPAEGECAGRVVPDPTTRLFRDDIPYGLCVIKDFAALMDIKTPTCDKVIAWHQGLMGKEYIVDDQLTGEHMCETAVPSQLGITSISEVVSALFTTTKEATTPTRKEWSTPTPTTDLHQPKKRKTVLG